MSVVKHWSRLRRNAVGSPSLVIFRTCPVTVLGNLLLLSLLEQSAWVGDHKSSLPASAVLWFWQLSGTIRACYRILKWRSARTYQMKVDWEGTTALYFPTLNFWGKKDHFMLSASRNTMSDTKCIMQPFYSISLLFHVRWASSIILLPVELFWCAFDCMWCT